MASKRHELLKQAAKEYFESEGYTITNEPRIENTEGEIIVPDLICEKEGNKITVECEQSPKFMQSEWREKRKVEGYNLKIVIEEASLWDRSNNPRSQVAGFSNTEQLNIRYNQLLKKGLLLVLPIKGRKEIIKNGKPIFPEGRKGITVYITPEQYKFLKDNKINPSEIFRDVVDKMEQQNNIL